MTEGSGWRFGCVTLGLMVCGFLVAAGMGCKRSMRVETEEEGPRTVSMIVMSDPRHAQQLLSGFYGLESGAWRWTAGKFSVVVRPPRTAAQNGATLQVKFTLPDAIISKVGSTALSAVVKDEKLAPQEYSKIGDYVYARDVPPRVLQDDHVRVDFTLTKTIPPSNGDQRELGIVCSRVGLESK